MAARADLLCEQLEDNEAVFISGYPNIFYYSGFTSSDGYLLISKKARYLITDSRYTIQAKKQSPDFEIIDITEGFEKIFPRISANYIGYEDSIMSVREYKRLRMKLGANQVFVEKQRFIDKPRRVKDSDEIKKIAHAEEIGDEAFLYVIDRIKPGMTEREIALSIEFFMKKNGASALSFETIAASGVRSSMPHGTATDKTVEKGELLTLDFGCVFEGYCSDMTRTVVIGKADSRQKEIYDLVLKAQVSAINSIKPGIRCFEIDAAARNIIKNAGYGDNFGHGLGHSVGIEIHENPVFSPRCNTKTLNGNVITVEPGIYIEGFGGVRIEDLIAIIDDKPVNLTHSPKELIEI